jgi:hypothetical protein
MSVGATTTRLGFEVSRKLVDWRRSATLPLGSWGGVPNRADIALLGFVAAVLASHQAMRAQLSAAGPMLVASSRNHQASGEARCRAMGRATSWIRFGNPLFA